MNTSQPVWRSLLYVPANNPRFIAKAHLRGADGIILDLEDSVPNSELEYARKELRSSAVSASQNGADVLIRINDPDDLAVDDIDAAIARIGEKDGTITMGPHQVPGDAWIVQALDPQGAAFSLVGARP